MFVVVVYMFVVPGVSTVKHFEKYHRILMNTMNFDISVVTLL